MKQIKDVVLSAMSDKQLLGFFRYIVSISEYDGIKTMHFPQETKHCAEKVERGHEVHNELKTRNVPPKIKLNGKEYFCTGSATNGTCFFALDYVADEKVAAPDWMHDDYDGDAPF